MYSYRYGSIFQIQCSLVLFYIIVNCLECMVLSFEIGVDFSLEVLQSLLSFGRNKVLTE